MKTGKIFAIILLAGLVHGMTQLYAQTAEELLPRAIHLEEVKGDLEGAIKTYQLIINQFPENGEVCAEALLRMGNCYEKLGKTEAIKSYELILRKYPDQEEQVKAARARLAQLIQKEPAGFAVEKMDFKITDPFGLSSDGTKTVGVEFIKGQNIVVSHLNEDKIDYITNFEWGNEFYYTYYPVWSPDGKEIAYAVYYVGVEQKGEHSISVSDLTGNTRIIISSKTDWYASNDWMPDGSSILTFKGDTANNLQLGLVSAEGGDFRELVTLHGLVQDAGSSRAAATFSPDGKFIVYTDIMAEEKSDLFVVTSDGKSTWPLSPHPAEDKWPRWSPDGKHIIFLSNRHGNWALWGIAVNNGKPDGDPFIIQEGMGNSIFGNWTIHGLVTWSWVVINDIFLLNSDPETGEPKGKPKQLHYLPSGGNTHLAFAPDGERLAFIREDNEAGKAYLVVIQADEKIVVEVEIPDGYSPSNNNPRSIKWKPDGSGIGIYWGNRHDQFMIKTYYLEPKSWETLKLPFPLRSFEWSGDGKTYYFERSGLYDQEAGIFEYYPETGEKQYLYRPETKNLVTFNDLRCSKDCSRLTFLESTLSENNETIRAQKIVDLNSGESHTIADFGYSCWSPDGQKLMNFGSADPDDRGKSITVFSASGDVLGHYDLSIDLPEKSGIYQHDWSPNGTKVAFVLAQSKKEQMLYKNIIPKKVNGK